MNSKLDLIEKQLRDETPPLAAHSIPNADELLTRFRRSQTNRRTVMSIAMATVVVVATGYLTRLGTLSFRDRNVIVKDDSGTPNLTVDAPTVSDLHEVMPKRAQHKSLYVDGTTEPDRWLVELGEMNEQGLIPLILSRHGQHGSGEATTVGFVKPAQVREVPLWQLPPQTQDAIYTNWTEAGYQPKLGL